MSEEWRPVVGYEGYYEVSSQGNVRSCNRVIHRSHGISQRFRGSPMKTQYNKSGYAYVRLARTGVYRNRLIHRMVAEAFIPNPEGKPFVLHRDDNPANPEVSNLKWGSPQDNVDDMISKGRHWNTRKTHCIQGHPLTPGNVYLDQSRGRECKECGVVKRRRGLPPEDTKHGTVNGYSKFGCRCGECKDAKKKYTEERNRARSEQL